MQVISIQTMSRRVNLPEVISERRLQPIARKHAESTSFSLVNSTESSGQNAEHCTIHIVVVLMTLHNSHCCCTNLHCNTAMAGNLGNCYFLAAIAALATQGRDGEELEDVLIKDL